jgi:hypothetical protein
MATVSRPLKTQRRIRLPGGLRDALPPWAMAAVTYLLLLILGYLLLTPVLAWGQRRVDDLHYGYPRTTQVDGFVGHNETGGEPTHLIAINLRRQVSVLEIPGGDAAQVRVLEGPYLIGADGGYAIPHLALEDITGDGNVDLLLQVREEIVVYVNDSGTFRLITPAERALLATPEARVP